MRNPLEYYKNEILKLEGLAHNSTEEERDETNLSEEEIVERNKFVIDFIVNQ